MLQMVKSPSSWYVKASLSACVAQDIAGLLSVTENTPPMKRVSW
jgi:hypothetical protein